MLRTIYCYCILFKSLFKTTIQLIYGVWKVSRLPEPIITVFGGSHLRQDDFFAKQAHALTHKLALAHISVITGGGPGIMQAANCAVTQEQAKAIKAYTLGITVKGLGKNEPVNKCAKNYIVMDYFFARKWLMMNFSTAFVVFPGGFGTMDELTEVVTLFQTEQLPGVPVVLIDTKYWQPFLQWLNDSALKHGLVSQADIDLIQVTDNLDEAFWLLRERCKIGKKCIHQLKQ
jgi:uncharacterized protein (TIGR00730 family)